MNVKVNQVQFRRWCDIKPRIFLCLWPLEFHWTQVEWVEIRPSAAGDSKYAAGGSSADRSSESLRESRDHPRNLLDLVASTKRSRMKPMGQQKLQNQGCCYILQNKNGGVSSSCAAPRFGSTSPNIGSPQVWCCRCSLPSLKVDLGFLEHPNVSNQ